MNLISPLILAVLLSNPDPVPTDNPDLPTTYQTQFTINNKGNHPVVALYVSPSSQKGWGPNRAHLQPLRPQHSYVLITSCPSNQFYDIATIYKDNTRQTVKHWDVCDNTTLNLNY